MSPRATRHPLTSIRVDDEILLDSVAEGHAEALFQLVDANREHLRVWLPWLDANRSVEDTSTFIRASAEREAQELGMVLLITHRGDPSGVIGFNWIDHANRSCEIGYWLRRDREGEGIVSRSVRTLKGYAFETLDLNRIVIPAAVGNAKSRAIAERLGFTQEGIRRDAEWLYDHFVDHAVYALLRRDLPSKCEPSQ